MSRCHATTGRNVHLEDGITRRQHRLPLIPGQRDWGTPGIAQRGDRRAGDGLHCGGETGSPGCGLGVGNDDTRIIVRDSVGGERHDGTCLSMAPGHKVAAERFHHVLQPTETEQVSTDMVAQPVQGAGLHADTAVVLLGIDLHGSGIVAAAGAAYRRGNLPSLLRGQHPWYGIQGDEQVEGAGKIAEEGD